MNLYTAIINAAIQIELHPDMFNFEETQVPTNCGTPGCALGWINFFTKTSSPTCSHAHGIDALAAGLEVGDVEFYERMNEFDTGEDDWMGSAAICARNLRLYAQKYHGHEKPAQRNFAQEIMASLQKIPIKEFP